VLHNLFSSVSGDRCSWPPDSGLVTKFGQTLSNLQQCIGRQHYTNFLEQKHLYSLARHFHYERANEVDLHMYIHIRAASTSISTHVPSRATYRVIGTLMPMARHGRSCWWACLHYALSLRQGPIWGIYNVYVPSWWPVYQCHLDQLMLQARTLLASVCPAQQ